MAPARSATLPARDGRRDLSWTDAWIFASLSARGATTLPDLVARADMLNHAIPTAVEIHAALRALYREGLVTARRLPVALTARGRRIQADGLARRGGLFAIVDNMLKALRLLPSRTRS
jgi:hypothetical protein